MLFKVDRMSFDMTEVFQSFYQVSFRVTINLLQIVTYSSKCLGLVIHFLLQFKDCMMETFRRLVNVVHRLGCA